jgi:outer membrane scaffolding protein for murein synthesis (MipA/OmpV family)
VSITLINGELNIQYIDRYIFILLILMIPFSSLADAGGCDILEVIDCDKNVVTSKEEKGKWILGVGLAHAHGVPDYIGSDESRNLTLPLPYILYNGPKMKISSSGINRKLFHHDKLFVSLSLSGAIPVDSDKNQARKGMDDIDAVFEYGPSFKYFLQGNNKSGSALFIDLNFREARTLKLDSLNFSSSPSVVFRKKLQQDYFLGRVSMSSTFKFEFVSDKYAQTFYGVDEAFETATRESYKAKGGYAGFRFNSSLRWQRDNQIVSLFFAYSDISAAKYVSSPLVKVTSHSLFGGSYFWLFD